jgi:uncharacterized protein DUF6790
MFALAFFIAALAGAAIQLGVQKRDRTRERMLDVLLVWLLAFALGVTAIFAGLAHLTFPAQIAQRIGWETSPFQREVAFADLGYGVLGVLCIWLRGNFWFATIIMSSIALLGDAYGHIFELVVHNNHAPDNAGLTLYMDIILPVVLILLIGVRAALFQKQAP